MPLFVLLLKRIAVAVGVSLLLSATPAGAQHYPNTLEEALKRLNYDPTKRGPLLILDPEGIQRPLRAGVRVTPLGEEDNSVTLQEIAPYFERKVFHIGAISVLAPASMTLLHPPPGTPQEYARIGRGRAARLLAASLTPAQWRQITGPQGLGAEGLSDEQRKFFFALLPAEMTLEPVRLARTEGDGQIAEFAEEPVTLAPAQRAQVRLRVAREVSWTFGQKGAEQTSRFGMGTRANAGRAEGETFYRLVGSHEYTERQDVLKQAVMETAPNRLKRGDLPFDTPGLEQPVALTGAKTLGDLMLRIAEASGIEIYADRGIGALPLTMMTAAGKKQTARAGDLLKALCVSVCGVVRRVAEPQTGDFAYVLTEDVEGLGRRRLRLHEWLRDAELLSTKELMETNDKVRKLDIADQIRFAPGDPFALDNAVMQRAEADMRRPRRPNEYNSDTAIPVGDLPPAAQAEVRRQITERGIFGTQADNLITDRVFAHFSLKTRIVVPGYGEVDGPALMSLEDIVPRPTPPEAQAPSLPKVSGPLLRPAALRVALPRTGEEAERLLRRAAAYGAKQIWIDVSITAEEREQKAFTAACAVGKQLGVKVLAVVRLLRMPAARSQPEDGLARDVNVYGETFARYAAYSQERNSGGAFYQDQIAQWQGWDWVRAEDAPTCKTLLARLKTITEMPGLAGLVICDAVPPGYDRKGESFWTQTFPGVDQGYSPALRLACLRRENFDPIDLLPSGGVNPYWLRESGTSLFEPGLRSSALSLAVRYVRDAKTRKWTRLEDGVDRNMAWNRLRSEAHRRALDAVLKGLRPEGDSLPLFWGQSAGEGAMQAAWYAPWSPKPGAALPGEGNPTSNRGLLMAFPIPERVTTEMVAYALAQLGERARRDPNGRNRFVLDVSALSVERVVTLLAELAASSRQ